MNLAYEHKITVYDAYYVALAKEINFKYKYQYSKDGAGGQAAVWERGMARGVRERRGGGKIM